MVEELEPPDGRLGAAGDKGGDMGGAQEAVFGDLADDLHVPLGDLDVLDGHPLEAGFPFRGFGHRGLG